MQEGCRSLDAFERHLDQLLWQPRYVPVAQAGRRDAFACEVLLEATGDVVVALAAFTVTFATNRPQPTLPIGRCLAERNSKMEAACYGMSEAMYRR